MPIGPLSQQKVAQMTSQQIKSAIDKCIRKDSSNRLFLALGNPDGTKIAMDLVGDSSPQLGGDLDLNGYNIDFPTTANVSDCIDDDTMGTASATKLATSESIKAYVDASASPQKYVRDVFLGGLAYVANNQVWKRVPYTMTPGTVRIGVATPPTGSPLTCDIHYHATDPDSAVTIFASAGDRPSVASSAHTASVTSFSTTSFTAGGWLGFCIDAVGSTTAGTGVTFDVLD